LRYARIATPGSFIGLVACLCLGSLGAFAQTTDRGASTSPPGDGAGTKPGDKGLRFDILEYVVDGNTVLSVPDIEEAVYPFLGEKRSAGDVDRARDALEHAYQARGFQTVQVVIPQQGVESGTIHLRVIENPVGRLRVVN